MSKASSETPGGGARRAQYRTRAKWRSLVDFQPLLAAERKLLAACEMGEVAEIGEDVPSKKRGKRIRSEFLKFLMLGGDEDTLLADSGIQLGGAFIEGHLRLESAKIVVPLKLHRCQFESQIYAFGAEFESVSFEGSKLKGLNADASTINGALFLTKGFHSEGIISLAGAKAFFLICMDSSFESSGGPSGKGRDAVALNLQAAKIESGFIWRRIRSVQGCLFLASARIGTLNDDIESWRKADNIVLDGLEYERIDSQEIDADSRIEWLELQKPERYQEKFWPQPWEYLAGFLKQMGHVEDAKRVAIKKQRELRRHGMIGARIPNPNLGGFRWWLDRLRTPLSNGIDWGLHVAYGALAGYGYRPLRTVALMFVFWAAAATVYAAAAHDGMFGPTNIRLYTDSRYAMCGDGRATGKHAWTECRAMPPEYTVFNPLIYSLDLILPVVDLRQDQDWTPIARSTSGKDMRLGLLLRILVWVEILFGWLTSLLLVSALGRLIQKD